MRLSPSLWLWIAISRLVGHVLGFALGDRSTDTLSWLWTDIPKDYQTCPIRTDGYCVYESFFASLPDLAQGQHIPCEKGSGQTSAIEAFNTKCRQRQSGLVRRSCGTSQRIETDIAERFMIFAEQHNQKSIQLWKRHVTKPLPT